MTSPAAAQRLTASEFFDFVHRPENAGRWFELEQGKVVEMPPPGLRHGVVCGNLAMILNLYVRQRRQGYVVSNDAGVILQRGPDTVRGPDIAYFEVSQRLGELNPKFAEEIPTLVVEVWSPSDRPGKMKRRIKGYLHAGIKMVWLIDPEERDVTVSRPGQEDEVLDQTQELTGDDVLPGFRCAVADLFYSAGDEQVAS
jgi:Uma2 family endonuclease